MRNPALRGQLESLESLLNRTDVATGGDIELIGHWGRYLCVLTAGFLENAIEGIYGEYVRSTASPAVANFATQKLQDISNPKAGRFVETATSFSKRWGEDLEAYLNEDGQRRRNAINSIMNSRHQIAHGESTRISIGRVREYLPGCIEVVEFMENQLQ